MVLVGGAWLIQAKRGDVSLVYVSWSLLVRVVRRKCIVGGGNSVVVVSLAWTAIGANVGEVLEGVWEGTN